MVFFENIFSLLGWLLFLVLFLVWRILYYFRNWLLLLIPLIYNFKFLCITLDKQPYLLFVLLSVCYLYVLAIEFFYRNFPSSFDLEDFISSFLEYLLGFVFLLIDNKVFMFFFEILEILFFLFFYFLMFLSCDLRTYLIFNFEKPYFFSGVSEIYYSILFWCLYFSGFFLNITLIRFFFYLMLGSFLSTLFIVFLIFFNTFLDKNPL